MASLFKINTEYTRVTSFVWCQVRGLCNLSRLLYEVLGRRNTSVNVGKKGYVFRTQCHRKAFS